MPLAQKLNLQLTQLLEVLLGTYMHLAIVRASELISNSTSFATNGPLAPSMDSPISIGLSRPYSDQTGDFNGSIDDLRIFSRELNSSECLALYW